MNNIKIVIAPNAYKECLSAHNAAKSIKKGILKAYQDYNINNNLIIKCVPLADGGDGTMELLKEELNGKYIHMNVMDPLLRNVKSKYALVDNNKTAVIEMADASGLWRLNDYEKRCINTTTYGFGQLIKDAINRNVNKIILCIGGSATNDGGIGVASALGYKFFDEYNNELKPIGKSLNKIARIDNTNIMKTNAEILVACDVENPLLGPQGATAIYGPQKGLQSNDQELLEKGLANLAQLWCKEPFNYPNALNGTPGGGAAGGLGDGLRAFLGKNVKLVSGFELIAQYLELDKALINANLCITGEGAIDSSSLQGKVPAGVARHCQMNNNVPLVALGGIVKDVSGLWKLGLSAAFPLARGPITRIDSMKNASQLLEETSENIARLFFSINHLPTKFNASKPSKL